MITLVKIITILLMICVLLIFALSLAPHASADGGGPIVQTVTTTIARTVYYNPRSAASYCQLKLANGRTLSNVYGPECRAQAGQTVTLRYTTDCRPLLGCRPQLAAWQLGR